MKFVLYPWFQHFLIADSCFYRVSSGASFLPPAWDERNIISPTSMSTSLIKWPGSPKQWDSIGRISIPKWFFIQKWCKIVSEIKFLKLFLFNLIWFSEGCLDFINFICGNRVYWRVEVECWNFRVFLLYINRCRVMIWQQCYSSRPIIVKMRESDFVLRPNRMSNDDLIDVVKLVPILIEITEISIKGLKFRSTRDSNIQSLSSEEGFEVEKVEIILINNVRKHLISESMQVCHRIKWQHPFTIRRAIYFFRVF